VSGMTLPEPDGPLNERVDPDAPGFDSIAQTAFLACGRSVPFEQRYRLIEQCKRLAGLVNVHRKQLAKASCAGEALS